MNVVPLSASGRLLSKWGGGIRYKVTAVPEAFKDAANFPMGLIAMGMKPYTEIQV